MVGGFAPLSKLASFMLKVHRDIDMNQLAILNSFAEEFEPAPGDVQSIIECQQWAVSVEQYGVNYFFFDSTTQECRLYETQQAV